MLRQGVLAIVLLATAPHIYGTESPADLQTKIDTLNQRSEKLLGVSLTALLYLKNASPDDYFLLSYLKENGEFNAIKELERKGYVKLQIVDQLPDGRRLGKHLRIIPTALGTHLQTCLRRTIVASTSTRENMPR